MIVSEEWAGRIEKKTVDQRGLGRWATCTFGGKGGRKITIVTAYQVVKDSITKRGPKISLHATIQRAKRYRIRQPQSKKAIHGRP